MSEVANELMQSMVETLSNAPDRRLAARTSYSVTPADIQSARKRFGLSQDQFADVFGVSLPTLRNWEQGRYTPSAAAKALLKVIAAEPDAVLRALAPPRA
jgi:putative transcriptional regulator